MPAPWLYSLCLLLYISLNRDFIKVELDVKRSRFQCEMHISQIAGAFFSGYIVGTGFDVTGRQ